MVGALRRLRSEKAHSNSNRPGSAEPGPITITMEIFEPVGAIFGPTGPNISILIVFTSNRSRPGPLLLLCIVSLRIGPIRQAHAQDPTQHARRPVGATYQNCNLAEAVPEDITVIPGYTRVPGIPELRVYPGPWSNPNLGLVNPPSSPPPP